MESCTSLYNRIRASGFTPSKKQGQNFLIDDNIRRIILKNACPTPGEETLEIGPGNGALTVGLLDNEAKVWAIEKDPWLCAFLIRLLEKEGRFHLLQGDALKLPLEELPPRKLVSNLPYSITSPLLYKLWGLEERFSLLIFMVQWEVAQRLMAPIGSKNCSLLTVLFQLTHQVEVIHRVPRTCFLPMPDVDSAIVGIKWKGPSLGELKDTVKTLMESGFRHRRKTLINSLRSSLGPGDWVPLLSEAGIPPRARAQEVTPHQWLAMARILMERKDTL
jgi:16S rRNA (adenine1518-N6/adenine1519-N6)-dimethyltransferase